MASLKRGFVRDGSEDEPAPKSQSRNPRNGRTSAKTTDEGKVRSGRPNSRGETGRKWPNCLKISPHSTQSRRITLSIKTLKAKVFPNHHFKITIGPR